MNLEAYSQMHKALPVTDRRDDGQEVHNESCSYYRRPVLFLNSAADTTRRVTLSALIDSDNEVNGKGPAGMLGLFL